MALTNKPLTAPDGEVKPLHEAMVQLGIAARQAAIGMGGLQRLLREEKEAVLAALARRRQKKKA